MSDRQTQNLAAGPPERVAWLKLVEQSLGLMYGSFDQANSRDRPKGLSIVIHAQS